MWYHFYAHMYTHTNIKTFQFRPKPSEDNKRDITVILMSEYLLFVCVWNVCAFFLSLKEKKHFYFLSFWWNVVVLIVAHEKKKTTHIHRPSLYTIVLPALSRRPSPRAHTCSLAHLLKHIISVRPTCLFSVIQHFFWSDFRLIFGFILLYSRIFFSLHLVSSHAGAHSLAHQLLCFWKYL